MTTEKHTPTPRAPKSLRNRLRKVVERLKRGPQRPRFGTPAAIKAMEREDERQTNWRNAWINPEVEALLEYLDGEITVRDLESRLGDYY